MAGEREASGLRRLIRKRADDEGSAAEVRLGSLLNPLPWGAARAAAAKENTAFEIAFFAYCVKRLKLEQNKDIRDMILELGLLECLAPRKYMRWNYRKFPKFFLFPASPFAPFVGSANMISLSHEQQPLPIPPSHIPSPLWVA